MIHKLLFVLSLALVFQSTSVNAADDALDEVNRTRAARGLAPFNRDEALSQAAAGAADFRAARRISGHSSNDFAFLPGGARASAAGCAAWNQGSGWGACCTYENWKYAGAAASVGPDGKRYMHLFVSNSPNGIGAQQVVIPAEGGTTSGTVVPSGSTTTSGGAIIQPGTIITQDGTVIQPSSTYYSPSTSGGSYYLPGSSSGYTMPSSSGFYPSNGWQSVPSYGRGRRR